MTPAGVPARAAVPERTRAPARRPIAPRRVSGPARRPTSPPAVAQLAPPLRRLVDHPFLDRLVSGRTWIGIIAFALIGIVGMQVALLKLNAGIGRSVERAAVLQRENSLFTAQVSTLRAGDLQQAAAARQGMVYAPPGDVRYLTAAPGDAARAAASITPPAGPASNTAGTSTAPSAASSAPSSSAGASGASGLSGQTVPSSTSALQTSTTPSAPPASSAGPATAASPTGATAAAGGGASTTAPGGPLSATGGAAAGGGG